MSTNGYELIHSYPATEHEPGNIGLNKREYFAAMAMADMIGKKHGHVDGTDGRGNNIDAIECAKLAVIYADALIAELNKEQKP